MKTSSKTILSLVTALTVATFGFAEPTKYQKSQFKTGDADENGSLSQAEFVAVKVAAAKKTAKKNNKEFVADKVTARQKKMFDKADSNGDGKLTGAEFYASFPAKKK